MDTIYWDKLRILVTNKCNYRCPFCHNEGQNKNQMGMMSLKNFKLLIDFLKEQQLSEINFSGGEPFLNKNIVDMIEYADSHMKSDISCATNLSLISQEQIKRLAKTRVKLNIQFPFNKKEAFTKSTGCGNLEKISEHIKIAQSEGIKIGLNTIIQSPNLGDTKDIILFAIENKLPLKLLPQIGLDGSENFKKLIFPFINKFSEKSLDKGNGAIRWILENNGNKTTLLYIDSPCFNHDIVRCRKYGEIRVHPDFSLQPCILKDTITKLDLSKGKEHTITKFINLWKGFNHC